MPPRQLELTVNVAPASVDAAGEFYTPDTVLEWLGGENGDKPVYLFHGYDAPRKKQATPLPAGKVVQMLGWSCREDGDASTCGHYARVVITDETPQGKKLIADHDSGKKLYGSLGRWNPLSRVEGGNIMRAKLVELSLQPADMGLPPANFDARVYATPADLKAAGLLEAAALVGENMNPSPFVTISWLAGFLAQNGVILPTATVAQFAVDPATGLLNAESLKTFEGELHQGLQTYAANTRTVVMQEANTGFQKTQESLQALIRDLTGRLTNVQNDMATLKTHRLGTEAEEWAASRFLDPVTRAEMVGKYKEFAHQSEETARYCAEVLKTAPPTNSVLDMFKTSFPEIVVPTEPANRNPNRYQEGGLEILKVNIVGNGEETDLSTSATAQHGLNVMKGGR